MFNILINNIVSNQETNNLTRNPDSTSLQDILDNLNLGCFTWCQPGMSTQDQHLIADYWE